MIPYHDFGGRGRALHFHHANGYPPQAYRLLLERLCRHYQVVAMRMRALWPDANPMQVRDWRIFAADLERFLDEQAQREPVFSGPVIGMGHSIGATTTLRLALRRPERFSALVLIDPVIFPLRMILSWKLIAGLGLGYRLHPLVKTALRRRNRFESRSAMFENYRKKPIFGRMSDESLDAYVDSLACEQPDGSMELCSPPAWEARIYVTSMLADLALWRDLPTLRPPVLVIRGAESDTFYAETARSFQKKLPQAKMLSLPGTTHLVPLEQPEIVAEESINFLESLDGKQPDL